MADPEEVHGDAGLLCISSNSFRGYYYPTKAVRIRYEGEGEIYLRKYGISKSMALFREIAVYHSHYSDQAAFI